MRILPNWIDAYLKYTENSEPPYSFRLWTAIATIGAALERKVYINWDGAMYANMFIVLVARAGRARKGTAMRPAERMLRDLGVNLAAESMTREALIKRMSSLSMTPSAKLGTIDIQMDSAMTIFSEEWTVFIGYQNTILMADLCNLYDCKSNWRYETKTSGTFEIPNVWLHMFAGTTPELILSTLPTDSVGGGLTSRTIFVCEPDKEKVVLLPLKTEAELKLHEQLMSDLRQIHQLSGLFKMTESFINIYIPWRLKHEANPPFKDTPLEAYSQRRVTHFFKLAMVLNVARTDDMILMDDDARHAITILERTERNMPMAFRGMGKANNAEIMNRLMLTIQSKGKTTVRELTKLFWQDIEREDILLTMLRTLQIMNFASVTSDANDTYVTYIKEV